MRGFIDFQNLVQFAKVDGYRAPVTLIAGRIDAANDGGAATERDCGEIIAAAPIQHRLNIGFIAHIGHGIRRIGKVAVMDHPRQIMYRGAITVEQTVVFLRRAKCLQGFRNGHAGGAKVDLALAGHWRGLETIDLKQLCPGAFEPSHLVDRDSVLLKSPTIKTTAFIGHGPVTPIQVTNTVEW